MFVVVLLLLFMCATETPGQERCIHLSPEHLVSLKDLTAANKRAAVINSGAPRTVRMIYFTPSDHTFQRSVVDSMKTTMKRAQAFYSDQLHKRGHEDKAFRYEPTVHHLQSKYDSAHFTRNTLDAMWPELATAFDFDASNIYFMVIENGADFFDHDGIQVNGVGGAVLYKWWQRGGLLLLPSEFSFDNAIHEMGHAFELEHNFQSNSFMMSYGDAPDSISAVNADYLSVHPYFYPEGFAQGQAPGLPVVSWKTKNPTYTPQSERVKLELDISDWNTIYQVIFLVNTIDPASAAFGFKEIVDSKTLPKWTHDSIKFYYFHDSICPSDSTKSLFAEEDHELYVRVVSAVGTFTDASITLKQVDHIKVSSPDFNDDGKVDFVDFVLFVDVFGLTIVDEGYDERFDLDENGTIGFSDFLIFTAAFGK